MNLFLGIDGGGTRTTAWLADEEGKVLGQAETGPSNPLKVGMARSQCEILQAFRGSLRDAGLSSAKARAGDRPLLNAVCAGISGIDRDSVYRPLRTWMQRQIPARRQLLTTDAAIALAAAVRDAPGVMVIAGTGSIAYARDEQGKVMRAGGWGIPFDDSGSGYDLGRRAVSVALQAYDGRGPKTRLLDRVCRHFALGTITEIAAHQPDQLKVAALVPAILEAADEGDRVARELCNDAARELSHLTLALLKRAHWLRTAIPVVTSGGVFTSSARIRRAFTRHLHTFAPKVHVELLKRPPVEGAVWLARKAGNKKS